MKGLKLYTILDLTCATLYVLYQDFIITTTGIWERDANWDGGTGVESVNNKK